MKYNTMIAEYKKIEAPIDEITGIMFLGCEKTGWLKQDPLAVINLKRETPDAERNGKV